MTELLNLLFDAEVFKETEHKEAKEKHPELSSILAILSMGYGNQDDVFKIAKNKLKIPTVNENSFTTIDSKLINMVPVDLVKKYAILPFFYDGHYLKVSMADPTDDKAIGELSFFTDTMVIPYIAMPSVLSKYINRHYNLSLPEDFQFGINQHLKETFSKEKMLSNELESSASHLPLAPNPNSNSNVVNIKQNEQIKPDLPNTGEKPAIPTRPKIEEQITKPPLPDTNDINLNEFVQANQEIKPNLPVGNLVNLPKNETIEDHSLNINNILLAKNKDELFNAVSKELIKINKTGMLFFVRANFLQVVSSAMPLNIEITIPLDESSVFRDTLETQDIYTGPPYLNNVMKNFLSTIDSDIPEKISIVPIPYKDMIFAILYSEDVNSLAELIQIRDAIAKSFSDLVEGSV